MTAASSGAIEVVRSLLSAGVDVNYVHSVRGTALTRAVERGCIDTTKALLTAGADPKLAAQVSNYETFLRKSRCLTTAS